MRTEQDEDYIKFRAALELAKAGKLAPDAPEWALEYLGIPLALEAINGDFLPPGFRQWHWLIEGDTLAHCAAYYGVTIPDFDGLYWGNSWYNTVAHQLVVSQPLIQDFHGWHWQNAFNSTVVHTLVYFAGNQGEKALYSPLWSSHLHWINKDGTTVAHFAAKTKIFRPLLADFDGLYWWSKNDNTVAYTAVINKTIPLDSQSLNFVDQDGKTAYSLAKSHSYTL